MRWTNSVLSLSLSLRHGIRKESPAAKYRPRHEPAGVLLGKEARMTDQRQHYRAYRIVTPKLEKRLCYWMQQSDMSVGQIAKAFDLDLSVICEIRDRNQLPLRQVEAAGD